MLLYSKCETSWSHSVTFLCIFVFKSLFPRTGNELFQSYSKQTADGEFKNGKICSDMVGTRILSRIIDYILIITIILINFFLR